MAKSFVDILTFKYDATADFKTKVTETLWTINYWRGGKALLDDITKKATGRLHDSRLWIEFVPNNCLTRDDGKIWYDPLIGTGSQFLEPTNGILKAQNKLYVYLFHELIHFLHYLDGSYDGGDNAAGDNEEWRTTGLYEFQNAAVCENSFRRELGLPRRPCYCFTNNATSVLQYEREKIKRRSLNLPEQRSLVPSSKECQF
jgi:hypothetical protein